MSPRELLWRSRCLEDAQTPDTCQRSSLYRVPGPPVGNISVHIVPGEGGREGGREGESEGESEGGRVGVRGQ